MSAKSVKIGMVGYGTIGTGVGVFCLRMPRRLPPEGASAGTGRVVDKDTQSPRKCSLPAGVLTSDLEGLRNDRSIEIAVELVGGTTFARDLVLKLLRAGKHVVTANKALLAEHGPELYRAAQEAGRCIAFEASCCGGIPIISALRTGMAANRMTGVYGIFNGTCNYILTNMTSRGAAFCDALKEAQKLGFAEADPTLDINGTDTAHKLAILSGLAFNSRVGMDNIHIEGIENIDIFDIRSGQEMGYLLKLLAIGEKKADGGISLRVHPSFISDSSPLVQVKGPFNAISLFGNAVGNTMFYGRGAGMMATASAVVADIIDIALGNSQRLFATMPMALENGRPAVFKSIDEIDSRFYIRIMAKDEAGVFAQYGQILGRNGISISGAMQHEWDGPDNTVPVVITTHPAPQKNMNKALKELEQSDVICGKPICIRIVNIPEDSEA